MSQPKSFVVIGLGSFGAALATRLSEKGARVTGIDLCSERVSALKDLLYEAIIGDASEHDSMAHLPIPQATAVIISLGEDLTPSLLATLHAKELGARQIIVKGVTQEHGRILKRIGVDRVIFPETEIAVQLADRVLNPSVIDYLPIDPEYNFIELAAPDSVAGKTLQELNIRKRYNVWVIGLKDPLTGRLNMFPDGQEKLSVDQVWFVVGKQSDINRLASGA